MRISSLPWRARWAGVVAIAGILTVAMFWAFVQPSEATPGDRSAIAHVVRQALTVVQGIGATSNGRIGSPKDLNDALAAAEQQLSDVYTGPLRKARIDQIQASIRQQAAGAVLLYGGGVSALSFTRIAIVGSTATVLARATTWADIGQIVPGGREVRARPSNTEDYTFVVTKLGGKWLISQESFVFVPGSEP